MTIRKRITIACVTLGLLAAGGFTVYYGLGLLAQAHIRSLHGTIGPNGAPVYENEVAWVHNVAETLVERANDPWLRDIEAKLGPYGAFNHLRMSSAGVASVFGIHAPDAEVFPVQTNRATYYMKKSGEFLFRVDPGYAIASPYAEGVAAMGILGPSRDPRNSSPLFEYVDLKGDNAVPGSYAEARPFKDGLAIAGKLDEHGKKRLGMIDKSGNWVIEAKFNALFEFVDGLAVAQISRADGSAENAGFIDKTGEFVVIIDTVQRMKSSHHDGLALVWRTESPEYIFVNREGQTMLAPEYDQVEPFFEGRAAVLKGEAWGYIDRQGNPVIPPQYRMVTPFENGMAAVLRDSPALRAMERTHEFVIEE
jgi:hypothetical protein